MNYKKIVLGLVILGIVSIAYVSMKPTKLENAVTPKIQSAVQNPAQDQLQTESPTKGNTAPVAARAALKITSNPATNSPRFVSAPDGEVLTRHDPALSNAENAMEYFKTQGELFGITNPATELKLLQESTDTIGMAHVRYQQLYQGLEVFGGTLNAHFDKSGDLTVVNGTFIPGISVETHAEVQQSEAAQIALQQVEARKNAQVIQSKLLIFRENLLRGTPGPDHLAWEVEVGNGHDVRQVFYVDAHKPRVIDTIDKVNHKMNRRAYDANYSEELPLPNYPKHPYWKEGDKFPSQGICSTLAPDFPLCNLEADRLIATMKDTYQFFFKTFGRDSFDSRGTPMDAYFDSMEGCPNAMWNGVYTEYCPGFDGKDVVAHEFGHAVTEKTADLQYQWQSGALNEAFSDMWGDVVAALYRPDPKKLNVPRTAQNCSALGDANKYEMDRIGLLNITAPKSIAGFKLSSVGTFGPMITKAYSGAIAIAKPADACGPLTNNVKNKLVLMTSSGSCENKLQNVQAAGAAGVIVMSEAPDNLPAIFGWDTSIKIPVVGISLNDGVAIKAALLNGAVQGSIQPPAPVVDKSLRWLIGADSEGIGSMRDMWAPNCKNQAAKTTDPIYWCFADDGGGVHMNSGVPNHVFSLLSDGGSYQGIQIQALGLLKTAHLNYRALSTYLVSNSDFSDYGNALLQSCADLRGVNLKSFTGAASGSQITPADCAQVAAVVNALELRSGPKQCNFIPVLQKNPPAMCEEGTRYYPIFSDDFSVARGWEPSHSGQTKDFRARDWSVNSTLPGKREGNGYYAPDRPIGTCRPGGQQRAVLHLDSPPMIMPSTISGVRLRFQHYVAMETEFSGGNVKIQVNGGAWQLVKGSDFLYNPYNKQLFKYNNPMGGEPAFSGVDGGTRKGSWGTSIINLQHYGVTPYSTVRIRFDMGDDDCGGIDGWYIGEVEVYGCLGQWGA